MERIQNVTIVGAGTMGYSLAVSFSVGGCNVSLMDNKEESLHRAMIQAKHAFEVISEAGKLTMEQTKRAFERIKPTTQLREAIQSSEYVLETVYEDPEIKQKLLSELDGLCQPHCIIASNTSWLDLFEIGKEVKRQDKLILTHWFSPPHIMPLVEIAASEKTSAETIKTVIEVHKRIGKTILLFKRFIPGCFVNRLQFLISKEIFRLVDQEYINIEDVDSALKASLAVRWPVTGYLQGLDFAGLDTVNRSRTNATGGGVTPDWPKGPIKAITDRVAQGKTGVKSGKGFYNYEGETTDEWLRKRDLNTLKVAEMIKELGTIGTLIPK